MLITNGTKTRNIAPKQLSEYEAKGYKRVEVEAEEPKKPKAKKTKD